MGAGPGAVLPAAGRATTSTWPGCDAVLDVGAGDGWFAGELRRRAAARERSCAGTSTTRSRSCSRAGDGRGAHAVRPAGTFDVVAALDVLEHVVDDEDFLAGEIVPAIRPERHGDLQRAGASCAVLGPRSPAPAPPALPPGDFRELIARYLDVVGHGSLFPPWSCRAPGRAGPATRAHRSSQWHRRMERGRALTARSTAVLGADAAVGRGSGGIGVPACRGSSAWVVGPAADREDARRRERRVGHDRRARASTRRTRLDVAPCASWRRRRRPRGARRRRLDATAQAGVLPTAAAADPEDARHAGARAQRGQGRSRAAGHAGRARRRGRARRVLRRRPGDAAGRDGPARRGAAAATPSWTSCSAPGWRCSGADIERSSSATTSGGCSRPRAARCSACPCTTRSAGRRCSATSPALRAALATPFTSRWAFDVELLGRLAPVATAGSSRSRWSSGTTSAASCASDAVTAAAGLLRVAAPSATLPTGTPTTADDASTTAEWFPSVDPQRA